MIQKIIKLVNKIKKNIFKFSSNKDFYFSKQKIKLAKKIKKNAFKL